MPWPLTLGCHGDDGLRRGVVLVLHPRVVLVQQLRQRRRFGEQLADHVPADVGRLFESQDAEDLGFDAVQSHLFAVLPEVAGRALLSALRQQPGGLVLVLVLVELRGDAGGEEDGQAEQEQHPEGRRGRCRDAAAVSVSGPRLFMIGCSSLRDVPISVLTLHMQQGSIFQLVYNAWLCIIIIITAEMHFLCFLLLFEEMKVSSSEP